MARIHRWLASDIGILVSLACLIVLVHTTLNGQYGFHRDELLTYNNARHLDWGYVVYPPITVLLARLELELFGTSLRGFRFFAVVAQALAVLLTALATRELGGKREAQLTAAVSVAIGGLSLVWGSFLNYSSFDFPCWILVVYFVIRLLKSADPRWWLAVGAAIGLGMMAKYSMAILTLGVLGGLLLTPDRHYFKSRWFCYGAAIALFIMLPNILWQVRHHFISFEYLKSIHARDVAAGFTDHFLLNQLWKNANPITLPLWLGGLWYLFTAEGKRYRMLGWMYVIPLVTFVVARGRDYYLAPAYPMLLAVGAVFGERWVASLKPQTAEVVRGITWRSLAIGGLCAAALTLPIAPLGSSWWRLSNAVDGGVFDSQVGWPDMVATVAKVRDSVSPQERARLGILAGDEGEAGAVNLYGPAYGLPTAISGMNSNWQRGYGDSPPETVIVLGEGRDFADRNFESCVLAGRLSNRYGIPNSSVAGSDEIFVCRRLRQPWPEFWKHFQYYG